MNPILIAPEGSIIPADHQLNIIKPDIQRKEDDFISKLCQAATVDVPFMIITNRQLQSVVEYPDVFGRDFIVVEFLEGGKYDTLWNQFASGMEKVPAERLTKVASDLRDDPTLGAHTAHKFDNVFEKAADAAKSFVSQSNRNSEDDNQDFGDLT